MKKKLMSLLPVAAFVGGTHRVCVGGVALEPGQYVAANGTQAVTTVASQGNATRAEVATMLMRFCENVMK